jgi:hypothetical protein
VLLALLAHEEGDQALAARSSDRRAGERVGSHRQPADGHGVASGRLLGDERTGGPKGGWAQKRPLGVDVVLSRLSG